MQGGDGRSAEDVETTARLQTSVRKPQRRARAMYSHSAPASVRKRVSSSPKFASTIGFSSRQRAAVSATKYVGGISASRRRGRSSTAPSPPGSTVARLSSREPVRRGSAKPIIGSASIASIRRPTASQLGSIAPITTSSGRSASAAAVMARLHASTAGVVWKRHAGPNGRSLTRACAERTTQVTRSATAPSIS